MVQQNIVLSQEEAQQIEVVKEACKRHRIIFSKFAYDAIMDYFTKGKWGDLYLKSKK